MDEYKGKEIRQGKMKQNLKVLAMNKITCKAVEIGNEKEREEEKLKSRWMRVDQFGLSVWAIPKAPNRDIQIKHWIEWEVNSLRENKEKRKDEEKEQEKMMKSWKETQ